MERTKGSFFAGIEMAKAGNHLYDISNAIDAYIRPFGYGIVRDLVGHGIGTSLHEDPQIPNFAQHRRGLKLQAGMTLAIEPMINIGRPDVPFVDLLKTKRWWIVSMQLLVGAGLAGIAFTIPMSNFFQTTLAIFWLVAFSSATHDIAADGFYMLALNVQDQALYVGIRSTFYRIATIAGQGLLVMLAGGLEIWTGSIKYGWSTSIV